MRWPLSLRWQARLALHSATGASLVARSAELRRRLAAHRERRRWRDPRCLQRSEEQRTSENGEDGVLREIFRRLGEGARRFVEFGVADGRECCTRALLEDGWRGAWLEGRPGLAERARRAFAARPVTVLCRLLTTDNLAAAFDEAEVPREPDLLVIDVDGNDYWLLEAALRRCTPRVLVVEYNAELGPRADWVMPYDPAHAWDGSGCFGASLRALTRLLRGHGFVLVGCESRGVNAFFVRRGLVDEQRWVRPGDVAFHYASAKAQVRQISGDPTWFPDEPDMPLLDRESLRRIGLHVGHAPAAVARGARFTVALRVDNHTAATLRTTRPHPIYVAGRWLDGDGAALGEPDLARLLPRVPAGATRTVRVAVTAPAEPGRRALDLTLLQLGNTSLDLLGIAARATIEVR